MPCGLVLPAASAKLGAADWLPDVRDAAPVYWKTRSVPASTIQMSDTLVGSSVIPVGLLSSNMLNCQLPTSDPWTVYLNTLSNVESFTTQRYVPSVTMSLGSLL